MDFTLDKKHEMARGLFRDFAETEVKPLAQETDETEQFPAETVAKMAKYGFMGIPVPKEYGGQGCDPLTYVTCVEELSNYRCYRICTYFPLYRSNHDIRYRRAEEEICSTACKGREARCFWSY